MDKINTIITIIGLFLGFCCAMIGISKSQQKQRKIWIICAAISLGIAAFLGGSALLLPKQKADPSIKQGNCSTTGNVGRDFSPNCDNQ